MKLKELRDIIDARIQEFGDLDITSDAVGDGSILGVEVVRDSHICTYRGCGEEHVSDPRAVLNIDSDCRDC